CSGAVLLSLPSCKNDDNIINEEFEVVTPVDPSENEKIEEVSFPTAIIGNMGDSDADLKKCFTNLTDAQSARIIIVENGSVRENEDLLSEAYRKGTLIVVFNPDSKVMSDWSDRNDAFYAGPDTNEECSVYGFNNRGTYYSLQGKDFIDDDDVPLFYLCKWLNVVCGSRMQGSDLRSKDIRKRFAEQSITHTFKISLDEKEIVDGHWANASQLNLTTTANVTYNIYPIHVFDGAATGDYYAVEAEMTLHNAAVNNGSWVRRRGSEETQLTGFYLKSCDVTAELLRKSNGVLSESATHSFAEGAQPSPVSTADAAMYNPGFKWALDATVSGGIPDSKDNYKLTAFNNWTWDNSADASLPGVEVKNNNSASNVSYTLMVNGLPGVTDNLAVTAVPDIASGDVTFKYSWIWHIGDVNETSDDRFYMQVAVNPVYLAYQWITGGKMTIGEFKNAVPESKSIFRFPLAAPNRVATGSAMIRNSSQESYYIGDIKFWRNRTTENEPDIIVPQTISTSTATGGSGVNGIMLIIPAGEYTIKGVRYSMENDKRVNEEVIINKTPITVSKAGNITIDFNSDIFTVM
ncbi:MAG: hypothetical protein K2L89_06465, partial [Muribaculaceae bacterium]|nr:hypothetical protein [Muribaculaceae bacterium]